MRRWDFYDRFYPPSVPRRAKGGIRSQSKRGAFGESWWAKRWIAVLEGFQIGARLQRGRSYARSGQVLSVEVETGEVRAKVQGSRPRPYEVTIRIPPLGKAAWNKIAAVVSGRAIFASKLLAGEMPHEIEELFRDSGVSLFPNRSGDLKTECSCPDWSNPCKHIAAVYYLLGEEFDRDPFLIFKLRGMGRDEFMALLGGRGSPEGADEPAAAAPAPEPLPSDASSFWDVRPLPEDLVGGAPAEAAGAALPRRLGKFPFWRGRVNFFDALDRVYQEASRAAAETLAGKQG